MSRVMHIFAATFAVFAAVATLSFGSSAWADESTQGFFSVAYVKAVAAEMGASKIDVNEKEAIVEFQLEGQPVTAVLDACDKPPGCLLLLLAAGTKHATISAGALNKYNNDHPFTTALTLEGGAVVIGHTWFALGGMPRENLKANLTMFASEIPDFISFLTTQVVASQTNIKGAPAATMGAAPPRLSALNANDLAELRSSFEARNIH